jgi:hypothetical protein
MYSGSLRLSAIAASSFFAMSSGAPFGSAKPRSAVMMTGTPASSAVGTLGNDKESLRQDCDSPELSFVGAVKLRHFAQADHPYIQMAAEHVGPLRCCSAIGNLIGLDAGGLCEDADGQMPVRACAVMAERD